MYDQQAVGRPADTDERFHAEMKKVETMGKEKQNEKRGGKGKEKAISGAGG